MTQEQNINKTNNKNSLKTILISLGFVLVIGLLIVEGILGWNLIQDIKKEQDSIRSSQEENKNQYSSLEESIKNNNKELEKIKNRVVDLEEDQATKEEKDSNPEETSESEENSTEENNETTSTCDFSKEIALRTTDNYDIFGESEFDTVVCGYVKTQTEVVWDQEQENIYFVITQYEDEKFRESIIEGMKNGNTVNKKIGDYYALNLGCKDGDRITGIQYKSDETYLDDETQNKILSSNQENPLSLIISFDKHEGVGCTCCNLASKIRPY